MCIRDSLIAPGLKGPAQLHGQPVGMAGQFKVKSVLQNGTELHPQQPTLGQQAAVLLDVVPEIPPEGGVAQNQRLPKEKALLGAPNGKDVYKRQGWTYGITLHLKDGQTCMLTLHPAAQAEGYGAAVDLNGTRYFSRETAFPLTWLEESFSSVMAPSR